MADIIVWIVAFVVAISILVAVHEFGHYWVARRLGVKVLRFSIGFGKPIWRKVAGADQTEYVISALPVGGYVKMLDGREGPIADHEKHRAFNVVSVWKRQAILVAGPLFNFLFAIGIYWLTFMSGVSELQPVIGDIEPDSYAARAGLEAGQKITGAGGKRTDTWQQATIAIVDDMVDDGIINLELADEDGSTRQVVIDVGKDKKNLTRPGELLDGIGILVWPRNPPAIIGSLSPGDPAENAGIQPGDRVLRLDDAEIDNWSDFVAAVRALPGQSTDIVVDRNGVTEIFEVAIATAGDGQEQYGRIGAGPDLGVDSRRIERRYGPVAAMGKAISYTGEMSAFTVRMLWRMLTGDFSARNLSGPITIAEYAGETARIGPDAFLSFLAIVSISLGILNLLPVPILDGGQMVFQMVEAIKGSPLSMQTEIRGQQVGIVLLLMLMSLAFYNDILRLVG